MTTWGYIKAVSLLSLLALSGCVAEDDEGEDTRELDSSGGGSCSFQELVTASDRDAANACGTQVSTQFLAADAYYQQALELCAEGYQSEAEEVYGNYETQVSYARDVAAGFDCGSGSTGGGGGGVSVEDTSEQIYYNLCVGQTTEAIYASCYGPVQYGDNDCGPNTDGVSYSYLTKYDSRAQCIGERDDYLANY
ncbi:hypothetical protein [Marinimicrobium sp. LS-A18]|uniref:hypothetical protein n=1 Tax=Marinimicrobium sp. LS-A18 TaxID=1381596 RepID=UPI000464D472|nr:hypothetical protein [Marinimicrobium sp. LS-A18]